MIQFKKKLKKAKILNLNIKKYLKILKKAKILNLNN